MLNRSTNIRAFSNAIFFLQDKPLTRKGGPRSKAPTTSTTRGASNHAGVLSYSRNFFVKVHTVAMETQAAVMNRSKMMMTLTPMSARTMMMVKKVRRAGEKVPGHASSTMKTSQVFWDQWQCGARYSFCAGSNIFPPLIKLLKSHMHLTQYVDQVCIICSSVKVTLCPLTSSVAGVCTCTTPSTHISVDLVIVL